MKLPKPTKCRECGSASLTWDTHNKNVGQAQDGRLCAHEIRCHFVLGCDECSETLAVVSADQIAACLTETREASAEPSAPVERGPWQPLSAPGQVQDGDWLSFTVAGRFICAQARHVIDPGTDKEEIVYNRQKNHYFVTSMAVDGSSNHKGVLVAKGKS